MAQLNAADLPPHLRRQLGIKLPRKQSFTKESVRSWAVRSRYVIFLDVARTGSYRIELCDAEDQYRTIRRAYRQTSDRAWTLVEHYARKWSVPVIDIHVASSNDEDW